MMQSIQFRTNALPDTAAHFRAAWRKRLEEVNPATYSAGSGGGGFGSDRSSKQEIDARFEARQREIETLEDPERWDGLA